MNRLMDFAPAATRAATRRGRWRTPLLGEAALKLWRADARRKAEWLAPFAPAGARALEVGSGPGCVVEALRTRGVAVTAVDVRDTAYAANVAPLLYDGEALPFADDAFDVSLALTTLHHCDDPVRVLSEATRGAPRTVVIEDVYDGPWQRRLTKMADSLVNLEFAGHPHANRDDAGWRDAFAELRRRVVFADRKPYFGLFAQALYVLER
ncbi:MAG: class I SAM-dependent methyltransferase [Parvularculaceae bacterium]